MAKKKKVIDIIFGYISQQDLIWFYRILDKLNHLIKVVYDESHTLHSAE